MTSQHTSEEDAFLEGFYDIPNREELNAMSFVELASSLGQCKAGSAKFIIIENAMLRHEESAQRNNTILGAKVAGLFTLIGTVIGGVLVFITAMYQQPNMMQRQPECNIEEASHNKQGNAVSISKPSVKISGVSGSEKMNISPPHIETKSKQPSDNK